jgi:hypothetical protein
VLFTDALDNVGGNTSGNIEIMVTAESPGHYALSLLAFHNENTRSFEAIVDGYSFGNTQDLGHAAAATLRPVALRVLQVNIILQEGNNVIRIRAPAGSRAPNFVAAVVSPREVKSYLVGEVEWVSGTGKNSTNPNISVAGIGTNSAAQITNQNFTMHMDRYSQDTIGWFYPDLLEDPPVSSINLNTQNVNGLDNQGGNWAGFVETTVFMPKAGTYTLFILAMGFGSENRSYQVTVNNTVVGNTSSSVESIQYGTGIGDANRRLMVVQRTVDLQEGENKIRLQAPPTLSAMPFIALAVTSSDPEYVKEGTVVRAGVDTATVEARHGRQGSIRRNANFGTMRNYGPDTIGLFFPETTTGITHNSVTGINRSGDHNRGHVALHVYSQFGGIYRLNVLASATAPNQAYAVSANGATQGEALEAVTDDSSFSTAGNVNVLQMEITLAARENVIRLHAPSPTRNAPEFMAASLTLLEAFEPDPDPLYVNVGTVNARRGDTNVRIPVTVSGNTPGGINGIAGAVIRFETAAGITIRGWDSSGGMSLDAESRVAEGYVLLYSSNDTDGFTGPTLGTLLVDIDANAALGLRQVSISQGSSGLSNPRAVSHTVGWYNGSVMVEDREIVDRTASVSVGAQSGTLTAGTAGTVTFPVTTEHFDNGSYAATVANLPTGMSVRGQVTINNNAGTLTLAGSNAIAGGTTSNLTLTINGETSRAFTLTIDYVVYPDSRVTVGAQSGTLTAGSAGTVTFPVTTAHIENGSYTATVANLPSGMSVLGQVTVNNNSGTLTLAGNNTIAGGTTNNLTLTISSVTSGAFTLTIGYLVAPGSGVSVGVQSGTLTAGTAGTVSFPVTTTYIPNGSYAATVANLPTGMSVQGQVVVNNNAGTLTLAGNTGTSAGTTNNLALTVSGVTSRAFALTIDSRPTPPPPLPPPPTPPTGGPSTSRPRPTATPRPAPTAQPTQTAQPTPTTQPTTQYPVSLPAGQAITGDVSSILIDHGLRQAATSELPTVEIILAPGEVCVEISGRDMRRLAEAGAGLLINKGMFSLHFSQSQLEQLDAGANVTIWLASESPHIAEMISQMALVDALNAELLSEFGVVAVSPDEATYETYLGTVSVDLSALDLTPGQMEAFTGVMLNEETGEFVLIPGYFSEDGRTYSFAAVEDGVYGVMIGEHAPAPPEAVTAAQPPANNLELQFGIGSTEYSRNGQPLPGESAPFIDPQSNRAMLPLRVIAEALGAEVGWEDETRTVTITLGDASTSLVIDENLPDGMGRPVIVNSRTFVPVRYVAETLGAAVEWDDVNQEVYIYQQ